MRVLAAFASIIAVVSGQVWFTPAPVDPATPAPVEDTTTPAPVEDTTTPAPIDPATPAPVYYDGTPAPVDDSADDCYNSYGTNQVVTYYYRNNGIATYSGYSLDWCKAKCNSTWGCQSIRHGYYGCTLYRNNIGPYTPTNYDYSGYTSYYKTSCNTADETTPAPVDPATPAPVDPATPAPVDPATPAPVDPATPAPVDPATPAPVDPATPAPVYPVDPATPAPVYPVDDWFNSWDYPAEEPAYQPYDYDYSTAAEVHSLTGLLFVIMYSML